MAKTLVKKVARVTFPRNGTPPDQHGYPHYQTHEKANQDFRSAYARLLQQRRAARQALLKGNGPAVRRRWSRRAAEVRASLAASLGLQVSAARLALGPSRCEGAHALFTGEPRPGQPSWAADVKVVRYAIPNAAWDGGDLNLLVVKPMQSGGPYPAILWIPDSGGGLFGAESAASALKSWARELALAGFAVGIAQLPGLESFCATQNKRRILEGACALGEVAGEAAAALEAFLKLPGLAGRKAFVGGKGLGGLAALLLGALDARVAGVLAEGPLAIGTMDPPDALIVPRLNPKTDLFEITAALAPKPLALVAPGKNDGPSPAPRAEVRHLAQAAAPAYRLERFAANLATFSSQQSPRAIAWLLKKASVLKEVPRGGFVRPAPRPDRSHAICEFTGSNGGKPAVPGSAAVRAAWATFATDLRRKYRQAAGMPEVSKPLAVRFIGQQRLADSTRMEYHVRTGEHTWSNLTFLRPLGPERPRLTVLCLPGSGSDVAKVEHEYAHEVLREGWNACIIDARAALYPFHPAQNEAMAVVNQSLHDLLCCIDVAARREDVDPRRIATMGVSQGGTHSWMVAALDERITASAPVCGLCTYRSLWSEWRTEWYDGAWLSFLDSHSLYYFTPGILRLADQQDLSTLAAPRPFCLIGGNHDNCFPLSGMRECNRDLSRLYSLLGAAKNFRYVEFEGPHSMPLHTRRTAYAFFREHLG